MVRIVAIAGVIASAVATELSLVQQQIHVMSADNDYSEDYEETYAGKGKEGKESPVAPPVAPAPPAATPAPTPPGQCVAYAGNEAQPAEQLPYAGMVACQSSNWATYSHAEQALTNALSPVWPGTCTATVGNDANTAWWVQLAGTSTVDIVELTNRKSCCADRLQNVDIFVGGQLCANTGNIGDGETRKYVCSTPLTGNEIMLKAPSPRILTLCGFAAYGKAA